MYYNNPYQMMYQQQPASNKVVVNGIDEVRQKQQTLNSDMIYIDNYKPVIYEKIVDNAGQFTVKTFSITEIKDTNDQSPNYATKEDIEAIMREIRELKSKGDMMNV